MRINAITISAALLLCMCSTMLSAQERTQSYYNDHEEELLPDATNEFKKGNYQRAVELCKWYYIIVGDNDADSLREKAERCIHLSNEVSSLKTEAEEKIKNARVFALTLLSVNPEDPAIVDFLQWSERTLSDSLSLQFVSYQSEPEVQPLKEMVDLGLSVKWATCNLGASSPEEMGDVFAWGETSTKNASQGDKADWGDYKWSKGDYRTLTRYCTKTDYGYNRFIDDERNLLLDDDAARVIRGGRWRTPTESEINELINKCTWEWTESSGIEGYLVTSTINHNSIFLPVADSRGYYWSSSINEDRPYRALALSLRSGSFFAALYDRCYGFSIRPVFSRR